MDTFLKKHSTSIFRKPPDDTNSKSLWNTATQITCYRYQDHIMLYTYHSNKQKAKCNLMFSRGHTIVTSRELMWCYACSWVVRGDVIVNFMAQIHNSVTLLRHVISRGALVGSRAISVVAHISWDVTYVSTALQTILSVVSRYVGNVYWKMRQRIFLYDTKSPDYTDQHMRANAWEEIGKELKIKRFVFFKWAIPVVFLITNNK